LEKLPVRRVELPNDLKAVQQFVEDCVFSKNKATKGLNKMARQLLVGATVVGVVAVVFQTIAARRR
jgi:hypothetical protein